jgi:Domain of unknown function (DUF6504)
MRLVGMIMSMESFPARFIDKPIEVIFDTPPALEKTPPCPDGFVLNGETYRVEEMLAEWHSFARRGRMADNMTPEHAARASAKGSWGVGRFFFRVRVQGGRVFDLYYDRAPGDSDHRKGGWVLLAERSAGI